LRSNECRQHKKLLQLTGRGNPLGKGWGFSFLTKGLRPKESKNRRKGENEADGSCASMLFSPHNCA